MIRSTITLLCSALLAMLATSAIAAPAAEQATTKTVHLKAQTNCPISGNLLKGSKIHVDVDGYRIYTRSQPSAEKVKADPQKAIRTLLSLGQAPEVIAVTNPQTNCPIMGDEVNKKLHVDAYGYRIYVCCSMCVREATANPDKALRKILQDGKVPEPRPVLYVQSKDPINGKPIVKNLYFDDPEGRRIYVSDQESLEKVKADPEKAIDRVLANGEGFEQVASEEEKAKK